MIRFDEESHTYTNTETNERYISVTTLLGEYKPFFDQDKHSLRVANREGVSQELVLEMWKIENRKATTRGTMIHKLMENYILFKEKEEGFDSFYESYDSLVKDNIPKCISVKSENKLSNDFYKIAGTADLIYEQKDGFVIGDFKTNKKFAFDSSFNEWFSDPVSHLQYCEFNNYALQLSMYAYMYEKLTGLKCKKLVVFYLVDNHWKAIHCNYLKSDIVQILNHYAINKINEKRDSSQEAGNLH